MDKLKLAFFSQGKNGFDLLNSDTAATMSANASYTATTNAPGKNLHITTSQGSSLQQVFSYFTWIIVTDAVHDKGGFEIKL